MKGIASVCLAILCFASSVALASDLDSTGVFSYDPVIANRDKFKFYVDEDVEPARSDFQVVSQIFLSNEKGARIAVVSLRNIASGTRTLSNREIVAILANGEKIFPSATHFELLGGDEKSTVLDFGHQLVPILYVYTRN